MKHQYDFLLRLHLRLGPFQKVSFLRFQTSEEEFLKISAVKAFGKFAQSLMEASTTFGTSALELISDPFRMESWYLSSSHKQLTDQIVFFLMEHSVYY